MKFFTSAFAVAAFLLTAVSAAATEGPNPIRAPQTGELLFAGAPYTIKWDPTTTGTITLKLRKGKADNLERLGDLASNIPNSGSFLWNVPSTLAAGLDYAIEIDAADGTPNYTGLFAIDSKVKPSSTVASSGAGTSIAAKTTEVSSTAEVSTTTAAVKTKTTAAANSTMITSTFITSTSMRSNHTTATSHGNSTITSFTKTASGGKTTSTATTTTTSAKPTSTTGAATRVSGAGALMAFAAAAAVFVL